MTRIIAVCNQKGGVAKTTTTANLGAGLADKGYSVLLIDMDPQAALTYTFFDDDTVTLAKGTVYDLLSKGRMYRLKAQTESGYLDLVPANIELAGAEMTLQSEPGRDFLLKRALEKMSQDVTLVGRSYDIILIDCPPSLGLLSLNALTAADAVLIPIAAEGLPLIGLAMLLETLEVVKDRLNPGIKIEGLLLTRNKKRVNLSREVFDELSKDFGDKLYKTRISENVSLAEAPMAHKTIYQHASGSIGASDYRLFVDEFEARALLRETRIVERAFEE